MAKKLSRFTLIFLREAKYVFLKMNMEYLHVSSIYIELPYKQENKATLNFPNEKIKMKSRLYKIEYVI
jgi:hypothetical protein